MWIDFAGDKKTALTEIFPWLLAEDNPVISCYGNNSLNKAGRRVRALRGISFQNLLGISLLLGEMGSNFPGELVWTFLGKFELHRRSDSTECRYTAGEQSLDQDCRGFLFKNMYCWGVLRSAGGYPTSFKFDSIAWGECTDLLTRSLGN